MHRRRVLSAIDMPPEAEPVIPASIVHRHRFDTSGLPGAMPRPGRDHHEAGQRGDHGAVADLGRGVLRIGSIEP